MEYYGGFPGMRFPNSTPFEQSYRCYSASFIEKPHLEHGNKVIMPPSALDRLASLRIDYPMLFEVYNPSALRTSHCGVLEFVAEEGMIYMPYWMMQNMLLQEGEIVRVKSATLPKGTFVKLQPHTQDFLDISNPKAVLETTLRNFSCLTVGDNIMVAYNNKKYYIDIVEAKPAAAISIIETDCEVDFAPPLDYKEPEPVRAPAPLPSTSQVPKEISEPTEPPKLSAFQGSGRRLDGKPPRPSTTQPSTSGASASGSNAPIASPSVGTSSKRPAGKLVFGTNGKESDGQQKAPPPPRKEQKKEELPKDESPAKFQAFSGKAYSLRR